MSITRGKLSLFGCSAIALLSFVGVAHAQSAPAAPAAAPSSAPVTTEEIIVTAQRREESLRHVPISVQAISGDALTKGAATDTESLINMVPSLNFNSGGNTAQSSFALRGVSSVTLNTGVQSSTAMIIDGVPVARQAEFISELSDIQRVEVLNGPQGTLFGKNSSAGVINIISRRPTQEHEGWLQAGATTDREVSLQGLINLPLSDKVAFRGLAYYSHLDPTIKNLYGANAGGDEVYGAEGKLLLNFSNDLNLLISAGGSRSTNTFGAYILVIPRNAQQLAVVGYTPGSTHPVINQDAQNITQDTAYHTTAELNWNISEAWHLTSVTAYRSFLNRNDVDNDLTPVGVDLGTGFTPNPLNYPIRRVSRGLDRGADLTYYYSEELRLNYTAGPINAVIGGYYQNLHEPIILTNPTVYNSEFLGRPPGSLFFSDTYQNYGLLDDTASVFGDTTYQLTSTLKVFGGARFTYENLKYFHLSEVFLNNIVGNFDPITLVNTAPPASTTIFNVNDAVYNTSGRVGGSWAPTSNADVYFSYARGYKGPGVDTTRTATAAHAFVSPEISEAFELGTKLRLLDGKLNLNVALFDQTIKGIQAAKTDPGPPVQTVLTNAGNLETRGVDVDFDYAATSAIRVYGGVSYNHAVYRDLLLGCNATQTPGVGNCQLYGTIFEQNLGGAQSIGTPEVKWTLNTRYSGSFAGGATYYLQAGYTWQSSVIYQLDHNPNSQQGPHGSLDMSVGYTTSDRKWDVVAFGKNITGDFYYSNLLAIPSAIATKFGNVSRDFQAYGGVTIKRHFF